MVGSGGGLTETKGKSYSWCGVNDTVKSAWIIRLDVCCHEVK